MLGLVDERAILSSIRTKIASAAISTSISGSVRQLSVDGVESDAATEFSEFLLKDAQISPFPGTTRGNTFAFP